ncbi:MAG: hypothetical protein E6J47_07880, partial [Chloroflexi bacterium]
EGELVHHDSLGLTGPAGPGVLNLMTAGRGIAHSEETPARNAGHLRGLQLWVALPGASRETSPAFAQHRALPIVPLEGGRATLLLGDLGDVRAPGRAFSPMVGADVSGEPDRRLVLPLDSDFEHAVAGRVPPRRPGALDRHPLLPRLRAQGSRARLRSRAGATAAPGGCSLRGDDPDVVELRRADRGRDRVGAGGLAGRPPLRRGPGLWRSAAGRAPVHPAPCRRLDEGAA